MAIYTLEAFCTISASYMLFRFPFKEFLLKKLVLCTLLAIFSYSLRDITVINEFSIIVPMTYLVSYTLFIHFVSKIRILWASVMMITGYALVGVIQMIVLILFDTFGIEMADVQRNLPYLASVQSLTAAIVFLFSFLYYFRGSGFTYEFPRWRWKHIWLVFLEILLIALIFRFILLNNLFLTIAVGATLIALLILSRKMERDEIRNELEP
ncbi:hypothetical protein [Cohnella hongkongensis]|uniref:Uncharacterized protein n=1 Tax=Cohnella hongkongensis TaxID=178337 RepID=A0ABV9FHV7_9BACL